MALERINFTENQKLASLLVKHNTNNIYSIYHIDPANSDFLFAELNPYTAEELCNKYISGLLPDPSPINYNKNHDIFISYQSCMLKAETAGLDFDTLKSLSDDIIVNLYIMSLDSIQSQKLYMKMYEFIGIQFNRYKSIKSLMFLMFSALILKSMIVNRGLRDNDRRRFNSLLRIVSKTLSTFSQDEKSKLFSDLSKYLVSKVSTYVLLDGGSDDVMRCLNSAMYNIFTNEYSCDIDGRHELGYYFKDINELLAMCGFLEYMPDFENQLKNQIKIIKEKCYHNMKQIDYVTDKELAMIFLKHQPDSLAYVSNLTLDTPEIIKIVKNTSVQQATKYFTNNNDFISLVKYYDAALKNKTGSVSMIHSRLLNFANIIVSGDLISCAFDEYNCCHNCSYNVTFEAVAPYLGSIVKNFDMFQIFLFIVSRYINEHFYNGKQPEKLKEYIDGIINIWSDYFKNLNAKKQESLVLSFVKKCATYYNKKTAIDYILAKALATTNINWNPTIAKKCFDNKQLKLPNLEDVFKNYSFLPKQALIPLQGVWKLL